MIGVSILHKANMLTRSIHVKRNISKVAISRLIKDDSKQTMDWLLREYERRDKELLEYEKLSYALIPMAITTTALLAHLVNYSINIKLAMAYYCFCSFLIVFNIPFVQKSNDLKTHLSNLEWQLKELSQKEIWIYHTATPEKSGITNLLGNKPVSFVLIIATTLVWYSNAFGSIRFIVLSVLLILSMMSLILQTIRPFKCNKIHS